MAYFQFSKVKEVLGATGTQDDKKIQHYGEMADALINSYLVDVRDKKGVTTYIIVPVTASNFVSTAEFNILVDIANQLAVGYFYKFESGDTSTADQAESVWVRFFQSKWQRPKFAVRGAEY